MKKLSVVLTMLFFTLASGCGAKKVDTENLKEVATHKVGNVTVVLLSSTGELKQRQNEFVVQFALLVCSAALGAQTTASPSTSRFLDPHNGLSETELVARALANNPTLAAERQAIDSAKGALAQARLRANPSLSVDELREVGG